MPRRKEHGFVVPLSNPRCCAHCIRAPWLSFAILTSFWHHRPPWSASASRVVPGVMNGGVHRLDCQAPGLSKHHPLCLCDLFGGILVFRCVSHEISRACFMRSFSGAQTRGGHVATVVWGGQFAPLPKPTSQGGAHVLTKQSTYIDMGFVLCPEESILHCPLYHTLDLFFCHSCNLCWWEEAVSQHQVASVVQKMSSLTGHSWRGKPKKTSLNIINHQEWANTVPSRVGGMPLCTTRWLWTKPSSCHTKGTRAFITLWRFLLFWLHAWRCIGWQAVLWSHNGTLDHIDFSVVRDRYWLNGRRASLF